jgi:hypothetical protein
VQASQLAMMKISESPRYGRMLTGPCYSSAVLRHSTEDSLIRWSIQSAPPVLRATEFGAPSSGPKGAANAGQAITLRQAIIGVKRTPWIGASYAYSWQDKRTNPGNRVDLFGLAAATGSPKVCI